MHYKIVLFQKLIESVNIGLVKGNGYHIIIVTNYTTIHISIAILNISYWLLDRYKNDTNKDGNTYTVCSLIWKKQTTESCVKNCIGA